MNERMMEDCVTHTGVCTATCKTHTSTQLAISPHSSACQQSRRSDKQMSNEGDPSHVTCYCSLAPPSLHGPVDTHKFLCPLATRDHHLPGFSFAHTHGAHWCMCVCMAACRGKLCLNATEGPSLSHPHSSFAALCRRRLLGLCDDHYVVFV